MALNEMTQINIFLPEGLTVRPVVLEDAEAVAELYEAAAQAMGDTDKFDPDDIRSDWAGPNFNLSESARVVLSSAGQIIGSVTVWDANSPPVHPWIKWDVHPDYEATDLGRYLLSWGEQRAHQALDRCPENLRVALRSDSKTGYEPRIQVYEALGMEHIRNYYRMLIEMDEAPPTPQLPEGISIRTYKHPDDMELTIHALMDSFRDHWGFVERSFESRYNEWQHWIKTDKRLIAPTSVARRATERSSQQTERVAQRPVVDKLFDETLWFLAVDDQTGATAGLALCRIEAWDDPTVGTVDALGVLRPYRKRGLGTALLHHLFGAYWQRNKPNVTLEVDASSLTGAVRLYEKAGMHIDRQWNSYEKELRPGVEASTTDVER
jgi:mycothiol synthase